MKRLTDKDWHTTKFMGLNEREVLHRLWELENEIENMQLQSASETAKEICGIIIAKTYRDGLSKGMCWGDIVIDEIKNLYHI